MKQPDPRDPAAVTDAVRKYGSALWPAAALAGEFTDWRRTIRAADLRISVRRIHDMVLVEHLDHVVTEDETHAIGTIIAAHANGTTLTWDQALHQAGRDRLRPVQSQDPP